MDNQKFVKDAIRTESIIKEVVFDQIILERILVCLISAGTLLDMVKKNVFYGKPIDAQKWWNNAAILNEEGSRLNTGEYIQLINRDVIKVDPRLFHSLVGISTESAELLEILIKSINGQTADAVNIKEELGDLEWYVAIGVDAMKTDLDSILDKTIAKLRARYPDKFDSDKAINRNIEVEQKILKGTLENE